MQLLRCSNIEQNLAVLKNCLRKIHFDLHYSYSVVVLREFGGYLSDDLRHEGSLVELQMLPQRLQRLNTGDELGHKIAVLALLHKMKVLRKGD